MMALLLCAAGAMDAGGQPADTLRVALDDARSDERARHEHLLAQLQTPAFLEAIDSPADYAQAAKLRLHVGQVVDALARNPAPSAQRGFLQLTTSKVFLAHDERVIAMILASVNVRPAPTELVRFWDRRSRPDDGFTPTTIGALVDNGSEPALRLLEKKLADPAHEDGDKIGWMRGDILRRRNDLALLQSCSRLLKGPLPKKLRPPLVEILFDYRPGEWFKPAYSVSPPPLQSASEPARIELRKLGDLALRTAALNPAQKTAVTRRLGELDGLASPPPPRSPR